MIWLYYVFMALLVTALVFWAIIALRDDGYEGSDSEAAKSPEKKSGTD